EREPGGGRARGPGRGDARRLAREGPATERRVEVMRVRRAVPELMITLAVLALSLAALLSTGRRAVFFPDSFADNLAASLRDQRARGCVGVCETPRVSGPVGSPPSAPIA